MDSKKINFVVGDSLHTLIKLLCVKQGITITEYMLDLLKKDLLKRGEIVE